jgi:hypothetical protein
MHALIVRASANILEDILGCFVLLQHHASGHSDIKYRIRISLIGYFVIVQQMSGFADRIFGYFAILQQMSGFADRIFRYFAILLQVPRYRFDIEYFHWSSPRFTAFWRQAFSVCTARERGRIGLAAFKGDLGRGASSEAFDLLEFPHRIFANP